MRSAPRPWYRRRVRLHGVLALLALLLLAAPPARAQTAEDRTEEARASFDRGVAAYEAGSFAEALVSFQHAYELTENAELLYNVATVADRLRRDDVALDAYERYLAAYPDAEDRVNIEARIAAIRAAHPELFAPPPLEPVEVEVEVAPPAPSAPPPPVSSDPGPGPWILVGVGAAAVVGGVVLLSVMAVDLDSASRATTWAELSGPYDRVPIFSGVGWPLAGVGLALLGAGIGWAVAAPGGRSTEASARLRIGPLTVGVEGSF